MKSLLEQEEKNILLMASLVLIIIALLSVLISTVTKSKDKTSAERTTTITTTKSTKKMTTIIINKAIKLNVNDAYDNVIKGKDNVITKNEELNITDFLNLGDKENRPMIEYTNVDLDDDGVEEVIFKSTTNEKTTLSLLHYEKENVYGYKDLDGITKITINGLILSVKSDDDYNYYKLSFDGLSYKKVIEASLKVDGTKKNYKVNGTKVTEEEFDEFEGTIGGYVLFSKAN